MPDASDHPHDPRRQPRRRVRRSDRGRAGDRSAEGLDRVFDALREEHDGGVSPDVADVVMARLGYERSSAQAVRHERVRRVLGRCTRGLLVLTFAGAALWLVHTTRIERLRGSSVEEVVRASLARQGELLGNVASGIRPFEEPLDRLLAPPANSGGTAEAPAATGPRPLKGEVERWFHELGADLAPRPGRDTDEAGDERLPAFAPHKRA